MSPRLATSVPLPVVEALAAAIWIGGLAAIFAVARAASATLDAEQSAELPGSSQPVYLLFAQVNERWAIRRRWDGDARR
ncbi:MAG: hypothetical protein QM729_07635 [Solirubrobacterales bacterium]